MIDQVQKLESLLGRVRVNAAKLASERGEPAAAAPAGSDELELSADDLVVDAPASVGVAVASEAPVARASNQAPGVTASSEAPAPAASRAVAPSPATSFEHPVITDEALAAAGAAQEEDLEQDEGPLSQRPSGTEWVARGNSDRPASGVAGYGDDEGDEESMPASSEMEEVDGMDVGDESASDAARTPPPESGPQVSSPPARLDTHPELNVDAPVSLPGSEPTMAQLGTTLEFEGDGDPSSLELHPPSEAAPPLVPSPEEPSDGDETDGLEAHLPGGTFSAAYDSSLLPPDNARAELLAHDRARAERDKSAPVSGDAARQPAAQAQPEAQAQPGPTLIARPASPSFAPELDLPPASGEKTFGQLLVEALKLGR